MSAPTPTTPVTVRTDCSDAGLNYAVALYVNRWKERDSSYEECQWEMSDGQRTFCPNYAQCLDDVWSLVAGRSWNSWSQGEKDDLRTYFAIYPKKGETGYNPSWSTTLPRAICFALLRQAGVTVEEVPPLS